MKKIITSFFMSITALGFSQISSQSFTISGSFVVPQGVTTVTVDVIGAGGNGGMNGSGGGGGGGAARSTYNVTPGTSIPVVIGAAGGGSVTGVTSFSNVLYGTCGANGTSVSNPGIGGGGIGGNGVGGTIGNWTGGTGGGGYYTYFGGGGGGAASPSANGSNGGNTITWTGICQTPGGTGGSGGGIPAGAGGKGAGFTDASCNVTDPAGNGVSFGGGGGGGNGNGGGPGTGANGFCEVFYYSCQPASAPVNTTPPANLVICNSNTTTLTASATGTVLWYLSSTQPVPVATGTMFMVSPAVTTTYYATSTTTCNTSGFTAITVTVNATPTISAASNPTATCPGKSTTITALGANNYTWNTSSNDPAIVVAPFVTTTYTVSSSNNNCVGSTTVTQTVYPIPSLTVTANPATVCIGQSATITAAGAVTYSWNTGPTNSVIAVSPTISTYYMATGYSANNCEDTMAVRIYVRDCTTTGISAVTTENDKLNIYPNPGRGEFTIMAKQTIRLNLLNQLGQFIMTIDLDATNEYKTFVKNILPGIYFITGQGNDHRIYQKVIVSD